MIPFRMNPMGITRSGLPDDLVFYFSGKSLTQQRGPAPIFYSGNPQILTDGNRSYVNSGLRTETDGTLPTGAQSFTSSAWIYTTGYTGQYPIILSSNGNYVDYGRIIVYSNNYGSNWFICAGTHDTAISILSADSLWHMYTLTFNKTIKVYCDGTLINSVDTSAPDSSYTMPGNFQFATNAFSGTRVSEARIYNRVLTAQEIQNLYNATK